MKIKTDNSKVNENLLKQNEALVNALKYSFSKIRKPIARTKVNAEHYDKYFEIEQLLKTLNNE
jgi:hypothetical protein